MSPREPSESGVEMRLRLMRELLADLDTIGAPSARDLAGERITRLAVERILAQLVDLAADISHKLVVSLGEVAPVDQRDSFRLAGEHGIIPAHLSRKLEPSMGLRNVTNLDIDLERIAASIPLAAEVHGEYVRAVESWIADTGNDMP